MKKQKLSRKFWLALVIFSLIGQVAWVMENMYFNVFIYEMFNASPADISAMVAASSVAATVTTLLIGALSDKIGKRKLFICGGYIVWGFTVMAFAFLSPENVAKIMGSTPAAAVATTVTLVIIMDCIMTFMGSTSNDAAFNAWITDITAPSNRVKVESLLALLPVIAMVVVTAAFGSLSGKLTS